VGVFLPASTQGLPFVNHYFTYRLLYVLLGRPHRKPLFAEPCPSKGQNFNHTNKRHLVIDLFKNKIQTISSCGMIESLFYNIFFTFITVLTKVSWSRLIHGLGSTPLLSSGYWGLFPGGVKLTLPSSVSDKNYGIIPPFSHTPCCPAV
jgi:hypothetical protein